MATNNSINNTLPSPFTVGATSVTSTGTQLNLLNGLTVVPINKVINQSFTSSSTYTPTTGMVFCIVEIVGGGGGGGGGTSIAGQSAAGGGGGGAGYCRKLYTAALLGANAAVVIGAAGAGGAAGNNNGTSGTNSTFTPAGAGAILTAAGGTFGSGSAGTATALEASGGTAGAATNGDVNINGSNGSFGLVVTGSTGIVMASMGGSSFLGSMTVPRSGISGAETASGKGSGGMGGCIVAGNTAGSNGTIGICYITEFISA